MGNLPPSHTNRTPEDILSKDVYFDSVGYIYRAMSWLDIAFRKQSFPELVYACIEGRLGIEYLLFEELVISSGANLTREQYERCLKEGKLAKTIERVSPDYRKLQEFAQVVVAVEVSAPRLVSWEPKALMKAWGQLSEYLHWKGVKTETTEDEEWVSESIEEVRSILGPIWEKATSGQSGIMRPDQMHPEVRDVWNDFQAGTITAYGVKRRLAILRPYLREKYAQQNAPTDARTSRG